MRVVSSLVAALAIGSACLVGCTVTTIEPGGGSAGHQGQPPGPAPTSDAGPSEDSAPGSTAPPPTKDASTPPSDASAPRPDAGSDAGTTMDGFDEFQHHNLDVINTYRATLAVAPLVLDKALCTFALAGTTELSQDHLPHQHFIDASNNNTLWTSGFNTQAGENQGDPNGWYMLSSDPTQNELLQIDSIQKAMFDEGPGAGEAHGHYTNMMNSQFARLGVGLLEVQGQLYLTNDFSD